MNPKTQKILSRLLQAGVTVLCFLYLFYDLDTATIGAELQRLSPLYLLLALPLFLLSLLPSCLRLNFLCAGRSDFAASSKALLFGYGVNNLLPAKLGEIAKAAYLTRAKGIPASASLCAVFWERLADLNVVLLFAVLFGLWYEIPELYLPLLCIMLVIWAGLALLFRFPGPFARAAGLLPAGRPRRIALEILERLSDVHKRPAQAPLLLLSCAAWLSFMLFDYWFFTVVCGLKLAPAGAALVCIAGGVGMIPPSMPASLGPFEAGTVAALTALGTEKSLALPAALALHLVNMIPPLCFTGYSVLFEKNPLPKDAAAENPATNAEENRIRKDLDASSGHVRS